MYLAITTARRKGSSHPLPSMYNQPPSFDYVVCGSTGGYADHTLHVCPGP